MTREAYRIGIDARDLLVPRLTGVERVVFHFIQSLARVGDPNHEYVLFLHAPAPPDRLPEWSGETVVAPIRHPRLQRLADVWIARQLPPLLEEHHIDAFISPNTKFPFTKAARFTTVHGLEWHHCRAEYRRLERIKQWTWFQLCSRWSTGIITFAKHTENDIRSLRPGCDIPMCVVPEGVDPMFHPGPNGANGVVADDRLAAVNVSRPYVLSVCSLEPRKNLDRLIRAFATVRRELDLPHQLVLVGRSGWKSQRLHDLVAAESLESHVRFTGYVDDETLVDLYRQAALFVYPSMYEGFGLPVIEAMASGTPVVTSRGSSMREVAGDAALLADPGSDEELAAAIRQGLTDEDGRRVLREAGLRRAGDFSWDEMARRICAFLNEHLK